MKSCMKDLTKERTPSQEFQLKKVIFDEIEVREYPIIMGDNPAVSEGKDNNTVDQDEIIQGVGLFLYIFCLMNRSYSSTIRLLPILDSLYRCATYHPLEVPQLV